MRFIFQPKTTSAFSFLSFFGTKLAVKKKKVSTLAEPMHGGQNSDSPAVPQTTNQCRWTDLF